MNDRIALDTNVLIYLHEVEANFKKSVAVDLMASSPVISNQVLTEYSNVLRRLLKSVLYSENMQHELLVNRQLRIINPFV